MIMLNRNMLRVEWSRVPGDWWYFYFPHACVCGDENHLLDTCFLTYKTFEAGELQKDGHRIDAVLLEQTSMDED